MEYVTITVLSIMIIIQTYININLYRKNVAVEKELNRNNKFMSTWEENTLAFMKHVRSVYQDTYTKVLSTDKLGSFQSDDETGYIFKTLKNSIESIDKFNEVLLIELDKKDEEAVNA